MKPFLISVVMATFNGEWHLKVAIESILNQTFKNFEFIIIDDGSEDNSLEIIQSFAKIDNRIKIIKNNKNIGLTRSLNRALKQCNSEFIARQDVDKISLPNRLEQQVKFLQANPNYAFCGCNGILKQNKNHTLINFFSASEIKNNLIIENCFIHSSILLRNKILKKYGYYNESFYFGQDYELWTRLIYEYNLNAQNLKEKLIIINKPHINKLRKNRKKFFIQRLNGLKVEITYLKYFAFKVKGIIAITIRVLEILTFSRIMEFLSGPLQKIKG